MEEAVFSILFAKLVLGAIGVHNIGVFQMPYKTGLHGVNIDPAKLVTLRHLLGGQPFYFCFLGQNVDSGDNGE